MFAANQPKIDWKQGWIDHTQLPIIFRADNAKKAIFTPRTKNIPRPIRRDRHFIGSVTIHPKQTNNLEEGLPDEYKRHKKVFDEQKSQRLPQHTVWDHAIELLPDTPKSLPGRLLPLTQEERRQITTSTRLPTTQQMDYQKPECIAPNSPND